MRTLQSIPRAALVASLIFAISGALSGCEGTLTRDWSSAAGSDGGPSARDGAARIPDASPHVALDGAPPSSSGDAGDAEIDVHSDGDAGVVVATDAGLPPAPDAGPPPTEPCGALTEIGGCDGMVAHYCEYGVAVHDDCASDGQVCGMAGGGFYRCFAMPDPCRGVTPAGTCSGSVATYCEGTSVVVHDCTSLGQPCGDIGGGLMRCLAPDSCAVLGAVGACTDLTALFCDGAGTRYTDACGARGELCGDVGGMYRCTGASSGCGSAVEQEELRLTNAARAAAGLALLACDEALTRAARLHSEDMCTRMFYEHVTPEGVTFGARIRAQGVAFTTAGENIASGQRTPQQVHDAWMGSPGHRSNIMEPAFGRIGIGFADCGGVPLWTQDFTN